MNFTDKEINDAEEAITLLSSSLGFSEKEIIDLLEDGIFYKYGVVPERLDEIIDELKATFDAY